MVRFTCTLVCVLVSVFAVGRADAQIQNPFAAIDLNCAAVGAFAATNHQCRSGNRWVCMFEKARAGYSAYNVCTSQTAGGRRQRRFGRRVAIVRSAIRSSR